MIPDKLQLEVGGWYLTKDNQPIKILGMNMSGFFESTDGYYTADGLYCCQEANPDCPKHIEQKTTDITEAIISDPIKINAALTSEQITYLYDNGPNHSKKFDLGKPRMDLLPPLACIEVAKVLTHGAEKYGDYNWRKNMKLGRLLGACLRHVFAYMSGEDRDESGLHPLAHAACDILMILEYVLEGRTEFDDRYKRGDK